MYFRYLFLNAYAFSYAVAYVLTSYLRLFLRLNLTYWPLQKYANQNCQVVKKLEETILVFT